MISIKLRCYFESNGIHSGISVDSRVFEACGSGIAAA